MCASDLRCLARLLLLRLCVCVLLTGLRVARPPRPPAHFFSASTMLFVCVHVCEVVLVSEMKAMRLGWMLALPLWLLRRTNRGLFAA